MRLRSAASLSALGVLLAMSGCRDEGFPITDLSTRLVVDPPYYGEEPGNAVQFSASIGGVPVPVTWESSDTDIATVSPTGLVTGLDYGFAAITATLTSDLSRRKSASFTVKPPGVTLVSAQAKTEIGGVIGDYLLYNINVPAGADSVVFAMSGGTGDFDLHVNFGAPPVTGELGSGGVWLCRPYAGGNAERCSQPTPSAGWWFALLDVYDAGEDVTLTATIYAP
jgi:hypothetical protein